MFKNRPLLGASGIAQQLSWVAPAYAHNGNDMVEIAGHAKGAILAFNGLIAWSPFVRAVASTCAHDEVFASHIGEFTDAV